jgi:hypothetical protein
MMLNFFRPSLALLPLAACLLLQACSSDPVTIAATPPKKFEILGPAKGEGCGAMGLGPTAINFLPFGLNNRTQTAYDNALSSVPGATGLINVTLKEDWAWAIIVSTRCTEITGDAIKEIK